MVPKTFYICSECGEKEEYRKALELGWLIGPHKGHEDEGWMIIKCPYHITTEDADNCPNFYTL